MISIPEMLERASKVTEEKYKANPFAKFLEEEFGNPFEQGMWHQEVAAKTTEEEKPV